MRPKLKNPKNVVVAVRLTTLENQKLIEYAAAEKLTKGAALQKIVVQFLNNLNNE